LRGSEKTKKKGGGAVKKICAQGKEKKKTKKESQTLMLYRGDMLHTMANQWLRNRKKRNDLGLKRSVPEGKVAEVRIAAIQGARKMEHS